MSGDDRQRIDKWLWFARIAKSRTLAQKLAISGRIRVNRDRNHSASRPVKSGDILTIAFDSGVRVLRIVDVGLRRGPPAEARSLYEDLSLPGASSPGGTAPRSAASGHPTKRQRGAINALKRSFRENSPVVDD
jgi:ribosome-associated heat shock protein Hsp15